MREVTGAVDQLLTSAPPLLVYLLVFLVPALEAGIFLGFVLPGETAVLLGGAIAAQHRVSLTGVMIAAAVGAVLGDSGQATFSGAASGAPCSGPASVAWSGTDDGDRPRTSYDATAVPACSSAAGRRSSAPWFPQRLAWPGFPTAPSPSGT